MSTQSILDEEIEKILDRCFEHTSPNSYPATAIKQLTALLTHHTSVQVKEMVICAAIKTGGNVVFRGHRHSDCIDAAYKRNTPIEYMHNRIEGFITSKNRFVDREEAMNIAIEARQVKDKTNKYLFSEDIY